MTDEIVIDVPPAFAASAAINPRTHREMMAEATRDPLTFWREQGRRLDWFAQSQSNDQALLVGGVLVVLAVFIFLIGLLADRVGGVRRLDEEQLYRLRAREVADEQWRRQVSARLDSIEQKIEKSADEIAAR